MTKDDKRLKVYSLLNEWINETFNDNLEPIWNLMDSIAKVFEEKTTEEPKQKLFRIVDSETGDELGIYNLNIDKANFKAYIEEYLNLCKQGEESYSIFEFIEWLNNKGIIAQEYKENETIIIKY